jgi:hypothetical protein
MLPPSSISRMNSFGVPGGAGSQSPGANNFESFSGLQFSTSANISEVTPDGRSEYNGGAPGTDGSEKSFSVD